MGYSSCNVFGQIYSHEIKTHTMILVCAADDFQKYLKMSFKKNHKKCHQQKIQAFGVFKSARQVCNLLYFTSTKEFCIFEPKITEVIENSSKAPLNFSQFQCTYLDKNHFNIISA